MQDEATKEVIRYGIDRINDLIGYDSNIEGAELHNTLYNEDYFIIGYYNAEEFLKKYGIFAAIEKIKEYENDNFGEVTTDLSSSENVANMFAYIVGEEALANCETLQNHWDETLTDKQLKKIASELEEQL